MKWIWIPCCLLAACAAPRITDLEHPAPLPYAAAPGIGAVVPGEHPQGKTLEPSSSLSDRFAAEGQSALYPLPTTPGQQILIECEAWGFGRGTQSEGSLRVLDGQGNAVAQVRLAGQTLHQAMLPFVAGKHGPYTLELNATAGTFRYVLVRHDSYLPAEPGPIRALGRIERAHGWLPATDYRMEYEVQGEPGQTIIVHAEPTHERGRLFKRHWWFRRPQAAARIPTVQIPAALAESVMAAAKRRGEKAYPRFVVGRGSETLKQAAHSRVFTVPQNGTLSFWVGQHAPPEAGLFDLTFERDVDWSPVNVRLADRNDRPLPNVGITFLQEPQMARIAWGTTDDHGQSHLKIPNVPCTVVLSSKLKSKTLRLRTDEKDLYLVW